MRSEALFAWCRCHDPVCFGVGIFLAVVLPLVLVPAFWRLDRWLERRSRP